MLIFLLILTQDVTVAVTPEPMALTRVLYGDIKEMGTWTVRACSNVETPMLLPSARIFITAANDVRFISPHRAVLLLSVKREQRRAYKAARYIGYGLQFATAATGYARLSPDLVRGLALAIPVATQAADSLRARNLVFDSSELLQGIVRLEAFGCAEGTAFAALQRDARPRTYQLTIPGARREGITSIKELPYGDSASHSNRDLWPDRLPDQSVHPDGAGNQADLHGGRRDHPDPVARELVRSPAAVPLSHPLI